MTKQEILETAIQKAIDGGWVNIENYKPIDLGAGDVGLEYDDSAVVLPQSMIYDHSFAKALWGTDIASIITEDWEEWGENWQHHLQNMVVADDPIEYLGNNI